MGVVLIIKKQSVGIEQENLFEENKYAHHIYSIFEQ